MTPRPEYRALVEHLPSLMGDFGAALPARGRHDAEIFIDAIDAIDRELDALGDARRRRAFADGVLASLEPAAALEVPRDPLAPLRALLDRRGVRARFVGLARELVDLSERIRATRDPADYVACVEREGRLFGELAVLAVFDDTAGAPFLAFFRALAAPANLLDKLVDARGDHRRGELALRPGLRLHARLAARLCRRVPAAIARHPRRLRFVAWGLGWIPRALRSAEHA